MRQKQEGQVSKFEFLISSFLILFSVLIISFEGSAAGSGAGEIDANDELWAVAVLGPDKFQDYFSAFKKEFKKFYGNHRKAKKLIKTEAKVQPLTSFTQSVITA